MKSFTRFGILREVSLFIGTLLAFILCPGFNTLMGQTPLAGWGTEKSVITKDLVALHIQYREFTPQSQPNYENKIMSYILAIDGTLENRIVVVRTKTSPVRDYLMVKNRFYSVLEDYGTISSNQTDEIVKKLTASYGTPQLQKSATMKIYSFANSGTKVLMMVYRKAQNVDCKVYYYSNGLFRMLITE